MGIFKIMSDVKYMREAIRQAKKAKALGEVPIGCVIEYRGKIIGRGYNRRKTDKNTLSHAELNAIRKASKVMGDWRLEGCTMYITLEPCPMCAGGIINSRIPTVVFGARDENTGSCGSVINLFEERYGHKPAVYGGVRADECAAILRSFFEERR